MMHPLPRLFTIPLGAAAILRTLPPGLRPGQRQIFLRNAHERPARVDVLPDGRVLWVSGARSDGWPSLSGISFLAE